MMKLAGVRTGSSQQARTICYITTSNGSVAFACLTLPVIPLDPYNGSDVVIAIQEINQIVRQF
jgi:hypothetical protein